MLQRIEIENFVLFDNLVVEPSTDSERPLTIIRAENGSGKTTFLRALHWGMYGDRALPEPGSRFPIHPAWWRPDAAGIETRVVIEFEADGTSRYYTETDNDTDLYRLDRIVKTQILQDGKDTEPNFLRIDERITLMVKKMDGNWEPHDKGADAVIEQLLPYSLRDFFIMDTDEVTDFVGGSENKIVSQQEVRDKTTAAVTSLLGIEIFKNARDRIEKVAQEFSSKATKAIGDVDLVKLDQDLNNAKESMEDTKRKISEERVREAELADKLVRLEENMEKEVLKLGSYDELILSKKNNKIKQNELISGRKESLANLTQALEAEDLLATCASTLIGQVYNFLKPLHDEGAIPAAHLPFVKSLLTSGRCVCGQVLSEDNEYGQKVRHSISEIGSKVERANFLDHLYSSVQKLSFTIEKSTWNSQREDSLASLARSDEELRNLQTEERSIEMKINGIDSERIQLYKDEKSTLQKLLDACKVNLYNYNNKLQTLEEKIISMQKTITQRQRNKREAKDHLVARDMSQYIIEVIDHAYSTIERQQVEELSERMNRLFQKMAANVSDEELADSQSSKATLRMISRVGVRSVDDNTDNFEIFALNNHEHSMPPVQINGASRRVLALSFVLALCIESQTRAPLIADSLLNFMSGVVRRNTLRITSENSKQPILLLTNSDLESQSEVGIVDQYAGATYTLTGQWDAIEAGSGGDVLNWTTEQRVSLICSCGPRQYCTICERVGQAGSPGWSKRDN
ncbi:AAA family ATPase [Candidatus Poriferisocius sp.]|uniref:AAA family ATPase n=1 Tax=Candidatus Poriferisocius sp. TaxID=3101276 RepID=UPI003B0189B5